MPVHWPLAQSKSLLQFSPFLSLHAPAPLHAIVPLQAGVASVWPSGMDVHVPIVAARLQDWHVPVQALSQQTPSVQKLLLQSAPAAHGPPLHFLHDAPPQSIPVSSPSFIPLVQCPQLPLLSQTPVAHIVPEAAWDVVGMPLEQLSIVQRLPSSAGLSLS